MYIFFFKKKEVNVYICIFNFYSYVFNKKKLEENAI